MYLTKEQINDAFMSAKLEENYNFLQEDLIKLANAFIDAAKEKIEREERVQCIKIARAYNGTVADKISEVRAKG